MAKNQLLKIVNLILAILVVTQASSGLLHGQLPGEAFEVVHVGGGIALVAAIVLHVILNFAWVRSAFRRPKRA